MKDILNVLQAERNKLRHELVRFDEALVILRGRGTKPVKRYVLSAATRRKMAASQRRRWAKAHGAA